MDCLLQAAGTFSYLAENFTNAPSMDLQPALLNFLSSLMKAQARECLYEQLETEHKDKKDFEAYFSLAHEAAQLVEDYQNTRAMVQDDYIPESWVLLIQVKSEYYFGISFTKIGLGILAWVDSGKPETKRIKEMKHDVDNLVMITSKQAYTALGVSYLKAGKNKTEEASRHQRMCRELKNKKCLDQVMKQTLTKLDEQISRHRIDGHLLDLIDPSPFAAKSRYDLVSCGPDFGREKVEDLFSELGPLAVFSAKHSWTAPRTLKLHSDKTLSDTNRFGFTISTDCPVVITSVVQDSLAQLGGIKEGDYIVAIGEKDVKWASHDQVVKLIRDSGPHLTLKIVTPMDKNKTVPTMKSQKKGEASSPTNSGSSHKKLSWNIFKKHKERESAFNIILR